MSDDKEVGLNQWGKPSKSGKHWNEKAGRLATIDPEEQRRISSLGGKKSAENARKRKEIEAILKDKQSLLDTSIANVMEDNPDVVTAVMKSLSEQAASGDLKAIATFLEYAGIKAPKQSEVKVETDVEPEDAKARLQNMIAKSKGKVVGMNG